MSEKLLDPKDAAARLNITEEQVRAFARDGDLKFINMGRGAKRPRYRFSAADIDELIAKRKGLETQCRSTNPQNPHRISGTTSRSTVVGFTALRAARLAAKRKR